MSGDGRVEHLYVYGTLRPGGGAPREIRATLVRGAEHLGPALVRGRLLAAGSGSYPGLVLDAAGGQVRGDAYRLASPERVLDALDRYEGRRADGTGLYRREIVRVRLQGSGSDDGSVGGRPLRAWTYIYNRETAGLDVIESGDWLGK